MRGRGTIPRTSPDARPLTRAFSSFASTTAQQRTTTSPPARVPERVPRTRPAPPLSEPTRRRRSVPRPRGSSYTSPAPNPRAPARSRAPRGPPAAGPWRRALGRRPPAPGRRSGRRRRPRAVRAAGPHPRRGAEGLRRPAHALGCLHAASSVSPRSRDDVRGGPAGRRRVELRRPARETIAYMCVLDGMAARRAAGPARGGAAAARPKRANFVVSGPPCAAIRAKRCE